MRFVVFAFLTLVLLAAGWFAVRQGISVVSPPPAPQGDMARRSSANTSNREHAVVALGRAVVALGRIEPADGTIEVSGLVGDRLEELPIAAGDVVEQGQLLARLASYAQRKLDYEAAEAQYQEAQTRSVSEEKLANSRVRVAELGVTEAETAELDIALQQTKLNLARSNHEIAKKDWERLQALRAQRTTLVTDQEFDQQRLLMERAAAEVAAAEALLEKLQHTRELRLEEARAAAESARASRDQIITSFPKVSLEKQRDLALARLKDTEIRAPVAGTVLDVFVHPGETLRGPLLRLANLTRMVVVAEVYETEIKRVKPGLLAKVTSSAFEQPYDQQGLRGKVRRIAKTIATPELRNLDPLAMTDRRVVEVVIDLDQEFVAQASRLCNLQVDVTIADAEAVSPP